MPASPDLFRSEVYVPYPAGAGCTALTLGRLLPPVVLPDPVAAALGTLRHFLPLEVHVRNACEGLAHKPHVAMARQLLGQWAQSGVLVSARSVLDAARQSAGGEPACEVTTVGVLTCDRTAALERCVDSFARNARAHGDRYRVVVMDDSTSPRARADNVAVLTRLGVEGGLAIAYAGEDEKRAYAARLAAGAGVAPEIVGFALLGLEGGGAIGANRNALLLECVGEAFVSADDDTEARPAGLDGELPGVRFLAEGDPMEYRFFPARDDALAAVAGANESVLSAHRGALGQSLAAITSRARERDVDLDEATPAMLDGLRTAQGRVAATVSGIYGDSGMFGGAGFVMHWIRDGAARYGEDQYRLAVTSRELLRVAPCLTITRGAPFMTTLVGLDHRGLLPPFLPVLRDEDGVFGQTLACCFEDAHVAHVPRAILHAAAPGRTYQPDRIGAARVRRLTDLLIHYLRNLSLGFVAGEPAARLGAVGRCVEELGRARPGDYLALAKALHLFNAASRVQRLEQLMRAAPEDATFWRRDAEAFLAAQREAIATPEYYLPYDLLRAGCPPEQTLAQGQRILQNFGQLLAAWPALVDAARRLRSAGHRLARALD